MREGGIEGGREGEREVESFTINNEKVINTAFTH